MDAEDCHLFDLFVTGSLHGLRNRSHSLSVLMRIKEAQKFSKIKGGSRSCCCYGNLVCQKKMITTCPPMIGQLFDTMIVASSDKELL